jgi:hypothetical protein
MNHISKDFKHKVFAGDVSNYYEKLNKESCDEIMKKPYWCDTIQLITPDTFYDVLFDDTFGIIKIDTLISYYRDSMRTSSVSFPGAKLRDCNLWQQAVENYEKKEIFPIFQESNYIITNPVRDNKIVTRGHLAIPFAYPIIESAKYITNSDTFPEPRAVLSNTARVYRFAAWPVAGVALGLGGKQKIDYELIKQFLSIIGVEGQMRFHDDIWKYIIDPCTKTSQIDLISLCILGKPLMPQTTDYYRDLWNAYRSNPTLKMLVAGKFQANLQHNLAIHRAY